MAKKIKKGSILGRWEDEIAEQFKDEGKVSEEEFKEMLKGINLHKDTSADEIKDVLKDNKR